MSAWSTHQTGHRHEANTRLTFMAAVEEHGSWGGFGIGGLLFSTSASLAREGGMETDEW